MDPYSHATSENLSTYYPLWRHIGTKGFKQDYYPSLWGIPFLSLWYPPYLLSTLGARIVNLNHAFVVYEFIKLSHYLVGSFAAYCLTGSFFGAVILTYAMRMVDLNQSRIYSWCWLLVTLALLKVGSDLSGVSLALAVAGGYWPLIFYALPFIHFKAIAIAALISIPQLIITWRYMHTSVRSLPKNPELKNGYIPPLHLLSLIYRLDINIGGQLWPELAYTVGPIVLILALIDINLYLLCLCILAIFIMVGYIPCFGRVPARASYMLTIALCLMASETFLGLNPNLQIFLTLAQSAFILICHEEVLIPLPFAEPAKRPSDTFKLPEDAPDGIISNLPYPTFTGLITGAKGIPYHGGCMSLKTYNLLDLDDPDGDGSHDFPNYPGVTHRYERGKYVPIKHM